MTFATFGAFFLSPPHGLFCGRNLYKCSLSHPCCAQQPAREVNVEERMVVVFKIAGAVLAVFGDLTYLCRTERGIEK